MTDESDRERQLRDAATAAAESTFERFRDEPDSDYFQASGRTPEQTWQEIRARVGLVAAGAVTLALDDAILTPALLCTWNRGIFESTFPADAGRLRSGRDTVTYRYVAGSKDAPVNKTGRGTRPPSKPPQLTVCRWLDAALCPYQAAEKWAGSPSAQLDPRPRSLQPRKGVSLALRARCSARGSRVVWALIDPAHFSQGDLR